MKNVLKYYFLYSSVNFSLSLSIIFIIELLFMRAMFELFLKHKGKLMRPFFFCVNGGRQC